MTTAEWLAELTPTEHTVLELAVHGGPNRQLAEVLFVTEQTVKFHMSNLYEKLDVVGRAELIALYWQHRLRDAQAASA